VAPAAGFDLVVANMLLPELVGLAPTVGRALAPGGTAVVSGVLAAQRDLLVAAYEAAGLAAVGSAGEAGWLALTLRAG
jgi:ribosomal protein L11 methyltransferase